MKIYTVVNEEQGYNEDFTTLTNVLIKCHLPDINYPEDDGESDFGITLESALKRYGVAVEVPMA